MNQPAKKRWSKAKLKSRVSNLTLIQPVPKMPATYFSTLTTSLTMGAGLAGTTLQTGAGFCAGAGAPKLKEVEMVFRMKGVSWEIIRPIKSLSSEPVFAFATFLTAWTIRLGINHKRKFLVNCYYWWRHRGFCGIRSYGFFKFLVFY